MKNIHLIQTEKPSRLSILGSGKLNFGAEIMSSSNSKPQHIYITSSDEEIKEGDWCYDDFLKSVFQANSIMGVKTQNTSKKIILTTDPDLIADGVQAIDDEFLEWFVKNPSCESVEVRKIFSEFTVEPFVGYKIIIPQEEPKSIHEQIIEHCGGEEKFKEIAGLKPKQETLEEAAEKYAEGKSSNFSFRNTHIRDFIEGAKWQVENMLIHILDVENTYTHIEDGVIIVEKNNKDERMYSEEDMINFAFDTYHYISELMGVSFNKISENKLHAMYNFEQFKKQK